MLPWLSPLILGATLALILTRPRGIPESWVAALGAVVTVLFGIVSIRGVAAVLAETAGALLFLLGMMVLTILVEQAGVFDRVAEVFVRLSRGSGVLLFCGLFILGALVTIFLSLDSTIIMLTPVIYSLVSRRRFDALPFMFACTFVANTSSLALPISNLTNLLVYSQLQIRFGDFAARMWLPTLVAVGVNLAVFLWVFRGRLPGRFEIESSERLTKIDSRFVISSIFLALTLAAVLLLGLADLPLAWASLTGGLGLLGVAVWRREIHLSTVLGEISWSLFVFVIGMFVIVRGIEQSWLATVKLTLPSDPTSSLLMAMFAGTLGSNITNNVPLVILAVPVLSHLSGATQKMAAFGLLLGANIGPALTTYGSLATMLWLTLVRRRGIDISNIEYMKVGLLTVPPVLAAATLSLLVVPR